jgi:hypothetical protein
MDRMTTPAPQLEVVTGFLHIYRWPLIGCALGALAVYWYGRMVIVFSMLLAGELSIIGREILKFINKKSDN